MLFHQVEYPSFLHRARGVPWLTISHWWHLSEDRYPSCLWLIVNLLGLQHPTTHQSILVHTYRNTSPIRHRPIRWITPLKYKNVSLIKHHAPSSNAFPFPRIGTVNACSVLILFVQSPKLNTYLRRRYSLKCWPVRFNYKAPSLIGPVPYKWGITVKSISSSQLPIIRLLQLIDVW